MSYDLNIISVEQEEPIQFHSRIVLKNEKEEQLRYANMWSFMTQTKGVWYSLGVYDDELFSAMNIIDTNFDKVADYIPFWIEDRDTISNFTPIIICKEYKHDLLEVINLLIESSPIKTLMYMARYQGGEEEVIYGSIPLTHFIDLLERGKISFNICYIVTSEV